MDLIKQIFDSGVVGCGGAGFPTHVKLKASPEILIINGAECEPLLRTDRYLMIHEAEKYLGYPYVWGGSSPSTSFDCSGFVSYVINHCGNGWSYGRLTANGWKNATARVQANDVQPGDLVFFQGTYNTSGASHVGIVVDPVNKIMIHCGNPIQYASYDTTYWRAHAYCYGRLP